MKRIQNYLPWRVFFIVPWSKRVPTARLERFVGYASGVVKHSHQGINHGCFDKCWKLGVVILPFALPGFPSFTRIDTVHCMTKVRNEWHQRSAPIHKLMMMFSWNRHQPLQIYLKSVWLPLHLSWVFILFHRCNLTFLWRSVQRLPQEAPSTAHHLLYLHSDPSLHPSRTRTFASLTMPLLKWP